jgi:pyrimidine deaminase RibD-like protein/RNA-binding protein YhbY
MMMSGLFRISRVSAFLHPPARRILTSRLFASLSEQDEQYLDLAVQHARIGMGRTFPNPAVGCVIVQGSEVVGAGFHPKAGMPHAEVFALLQAAGHLEDGVAAAKSIVDGSDLALMKKVTQLTDEYLAESGPAKLFGDTFAGKETTAYVTLEPCCHHGKTPPCAASLTLAGVQKVVVGFRDPNPRVDGGGYKVLEEAGIQVVEADGASRDACAAIVENFVKRITPRENTDYSSINGAKRRALRALVGRKKADSTLSVFPWKGPSIGKDFDGDLEDTVNQLPLDAKWLEQADALLWKHELVLLRLNTAVAKKKGAKILGERIAEQLDAHVAQVVGHTALLYRPSIPAVLDLEELGSKAEEENAPVLDLEELGSKAEEENAPVPDLEEMSSKAEEENA